MSKVQKNEFNISGKVIHVGMPEYISDKFQKRILILEVWKDKYRNEVEFSYINNNMSLLNQIREGNWVNIDFRLSGYKKMIQGKARWFDSLEAVSCTKQD